MTSRFPIRRVVLLPTVLAAVALLAAFCPAADAQQFSAWSTPVNLNTLTLNDGTVCKAVVNSPSDDSHPAISKDGRPGSLASENLWVSTRASTRDQNWLPSVPINCEWRVLTPPPCPSWAPADPAGTVLFVNSPAFDGAPALSWDGTELYFFSTRNNLPGAAGGRDLYISKRTKLPD